MICLWSYLLSSTARPATAARPGPAGGLGAKARGVDVGGAGPACASGVRSTNTIRATCSVHRDEVSTGLNLTDGADASPENMSVARSSWQDEHKESEVDRGLSGLG